MHNGETRNQAQFIAQWLTSAWYFFIFIGALIYGNCCGKFKTITAFLILSVLGNIMIAIGSLNVWEIIYRYYSQFLLIEHTHVPVVRQKTQPQCIFQPHAAL